ncbi:MAG: class I fructose-bisphosphate aldolase [Limnospira sp.]
MSQHAENLRAITKAMMAKGKGILAMDESNGTCDKRFQKVGIQTSVDQRRDYREMILTTPNLGDYISGAILYDETIRQVSRDGKPLVKICQEAGIIPGIKVDMKAKDLAGFPGEKVTEGLDGLRDRIAEYYEMGARFAKWRAVIAIGENIPSHACVEANAHALARYAALCQEGGLVPIVEPEVLIDGNHSIARCFHITDATLHSVFNQLHTQGVALDRMVLKPSMVISGKDCPEQASVQEVATFTVRCLLRNVPALVGGVAFLSGGQTPERAAAHLNEMNVQYSDICPWPVTFSYARAIQQPALEAWKGEDANVKTAQELLLHRAKCNSAARRGEYSSDMEKQLVAV